MGNIFSYIADSFTNRGALDLVTAKDKETLANTAFLNETKPITQAFTPQANNLVAQDFAQQTMTALPRQTTMLPPEGGLGAPTQQLGPQTYSDPAAATRRYYDRLADQERARETARAQEQLSDPMFRFRDTVTDVARNTIGLPFNILSGGQAFSNDPSREAQSRHEQRLKELDALNGENARLYDAAKDGRFAALEKMSNDRSTAFTNRLNARTSSGNSVREKILAGVAKVNSRDYTPESYQTWYRSVQDALNTNDPSKVKFDALEFTPEYTAIANALGGSDIFDMGKGGSSTREGTVENIDRDSEKGQLMTLRSSFMTDQSTYFGERRSYKSRISDWNNKASEMSDLIGRARDSMAKGGAGLTGNAFKDMWFTEGRRLKNTLQVMKNRIGFDTLQAMRTDPDNKTGGALGQVAVQELDALQNSIDALDQATTQEELNIALDNVERHYMRLGDKLEGTMFEMDKLYGTGYNNAVEFGQYMLEGDGTLNSFFKQQPLTPYPEGVPTRGVSEDALSPEEINQMFNGQGQGQGQNNNNLQQGFNY
jgi:hypothetical protein